MRRRTDRYPYLSISIVMAEEIAGFKPKVSDTRKNLKLATAVELEEIDKRYPQFVEQITPENHAEAIQYINYVWEAEKQHRELLEKNQIWHGYIFWIVKPKDRRQPIPLFCMSKLRFNTFGVSRSDMPDLRRTVRKIHGYQMKKLNLPACFTNFWKIF